MGIFRATVDLRFPAGSSRGTNTWHLRTVTEDGSTTELTALMGFVQDFYTNLQANYPVGYVISWDGSAQQVGTPTPQLLAASTPWTVNGTNTNGFGPAPAMACVTWRSTLATKRGRGRTFLGPLASTAFQTADGTLADASLTSVRNAADALVDDSTAAGAFGALGVYSESDGVLRDFIAYSVNDQAAVLRSRRS